MRVPAPRVHRGGRPGKPPIELRVRLLGRIEIEVDGRPLRLAGRQAQALVALLVLVRRVRSREAIAADLWPDSPSASGSLRQALWLLRSSLVAIGVNPDDVLDADPDALGLRGELRLVVDVDAFDAAAARGRDDAEFATTLYHGELAECLGHECFARERERLADAYEDALVVVAERSLADGDLAGARRLAQQLLARDPLREEAHSVLLRAYGHDGSRSQVLRQYRRLADVLRRELDVEPLPETTEAFRAAIRETEARSAEALLVRQLTEPRLVAVGPGHSAAAVSRAS